MILSHTNLFVSVHRVYDFDTMSPDPDCHRDSISRKVRKMRMPIFRTINYSERRLSTGFAIAARIAW